MDIQLVHAVVLLGLVVLHASNAWVLHAARRRQVLHGAMVIVYACAITPTFALFSLSYGLLLTALAAVPFVVGRPGSRAGAVPLVVPASTAEPNEVAPAFVPAPLAPEHAT